MRESQTVPAGNGSIHNYIRITGHRPGPINPRSKKEGGRGNFSERFQDRHLRQLSGVFLRNSSAKRTASAGTVFRAMPKLRAAKKLRVG